MGIFSRARDIISANINALLDQAEDPEKLVGMMAREMEDTLIDLKASCAGAMAAKRRIAADRCDVEAEAALWRDRARLAVSRGRDDLAREALVEKGRFLERAEALGAQETECDHVIERYKEDIAELEDKLKYVREKQRVLVERHTHARNRKRAQSNIRRVDTSDILARFALFEHQIDRMEAEGDLVNSYKRPSLDEQFSALEDNRGIDEELEALKAESRV